ncbi:MAG: MFS transporter [Saprospiraceae bacterium]|jgi:hypothetical protein|nr:MFS transporter [Saprospiraceae bacterium]
MKKVFKFIAWTLGTLLAVLLLAFVVFQLYFMEINRQAKKALKEKPTLTENGHTFRDLNANGKLDPYEDSRATLEARIEDLLSQMTIEEKVGQMWHPPIGIGAGNFGETRPRGNILQLHLPPKNQPFQPLQDTQPRSPRRMVQQAATLVITAISAALLQLIDTSIVNVSLREISGSIGATTTEIAWVVTSYAVSNVIMIPLAGMMSDLFGRKN